MGKLLKTITQLTLLTLLISFFSFLGYREVSLLHNTLYENGNWVVTKTRLKKAVVGSYGFLVSRATLSGEYLDLSRWFGYQEVIYREALGIREITFDFFLAKDSYMVFIFNKDEDKFSGIRISSDNLYKNLYFICKKSGEFINKQELKDVSIRVNNWQNLRIVFDQNNLSLYINKNLFGVFNTTLLPYQRFGFRGGKNKALIDNIFIRLRNSKQVIVERFDKPYRKALPLLITFILSANIGVGLFFYIISKYHLALIARRLITFNLMGVVVLTLWLTFDYFYVSKQYPIWKNLKVTIPQGLRSDVEDYWRFSKKEFILSSIKNKYAYAPAIDTYRILFLGSSQVWGAGASEEKEIFVNKIQSKFNELNYGGIKYECINAGISGFDIKETVNFYINELPRINPGIVVFILPLNKLDINSVPVLNQLIQFNNSLKIKTFILLGCVSPEYYRTTFSAYILEELLEKHNLKIVNLNEYFLKDYDLGLIWWDYAHLTDFGQSLLASYVYGIIRKEIL